jgi:hypothetical protein
MADFNKRLNEALEAVPLTIEHCGVCADILKPVKSTLRRSGQRFSVAKSDVPPPTHSNLKRVRVNLSDDVLREIGEAPVGAQTGSAAGGYTLDMAKGQLDSLVKQWMLLAVKLYPAGSRAQDAFLELGKRLGEITGRLQTDFIEGKLINQPGATDSPVGAPPAGEESELGEPTPAVPPVPAGGAGEAGGEGELEELAGELE